MSVASRRERERQERRNAILDAAEQVFFDKGIEVATMDDVAARAELSKGTLYLYFKNKDDLFIGVASRVIEGVIARFDALVDQSGPGVDRLREMVRLYADTVAEHPNHFRMMMSRLGSGYQVSDTSSPEFACHRSRVGQVIGAFTSVLRQGQADGTVRGDLDPLQTAVQLWGGLIGTLLLQIINREEMQKRISEPLQFDRFVDFYIDLLTNGLRPRTDPEPAS